MQEARALEAGVCKCACVSGLHSHPGTRSLSYKWGLSFQSPVRPLIPPADL